MNNFWELPFWHQAGLFALVAAFIAFVTFVAIAFVKIARPTEAGKDGVKFGGGGGEKPKDEEPSLAHHRLFKLFEACEAPGALALDGSSDKSILCENYLKLKFTTLYDNFLEFFKKAERNDFDGLSRLPAAVNEWVAEYEHKADKMETITSKGTICGVPRCFRQKFAKWHQRHATQLFEDYNHILSDRLHKNPRERALLLLESSFYAIRETVMDAKYTLDNLNGDLDKEISEMVAESCKE